MAIKLNKNWVLLGAAVALGLGAMVLSNSLIHNRIAQLEEEAKRGHQTVEVVVARRDLERGDTLTADVVAVRQVPKEFVHHTAVRPNQFELFERQRLAVPLKRGETLLEAHTEGKGTSVFSATLKKGLRALTFEVDAVNSISGMLRPGDRIDLIYSARQTNGAGQAEQDVAVPLLSDVVVLATGQSLTKQDEHDGKERTFSTVTLELSPLDANRIILAKTAGRLTAVLRNPDDRVGNATGMLGVASLLGGARQAAFAQGRTVEFIIGGGGAPGSVVNVSAPPTTTKQ
jgi:pilus assembly protein CpaB